MALMAFSTACVASMTASIRLVPGDLHPFEIAFFRNFIGLLLLLGWHIKGGLRIFQTRQIHLHALRGGLNVLAMLAYFFAVTITPLAEIAAMGFTAPLFAAPLAFLLLREKAHWYRVLVVAIGFSGAMAILRPGAETLNLGAMLVLLSSFLWALALMVIKVLSRTESAATIALYMVVFMAPLSLLAALPYWQGPNLHQLAWLALIALLGTLAQLSLGQSFKFADSTAVMPLDFLKLIWGAMLGYWLFSESPDIWTWLGGAVIFSSATWLALKESR